MKSSKLPAFATWLVEHVIPGDNNEALAGDLMEQLRQGRSVSWYWRQVLGAILVGWSKELRILWTAVGITMVWTLGISKYYGRLWVYAQSQAYTIWGMRHGWTLGITFEIEGFTVFNALPLALAVCMYLGLTRMFSLRRFLRGFSAGLLTLALGIYICVIQSPKWLLHHKETFVGHLVASLPVLFGLFVSMWAAKPNSTERRKMQSALA